MDEAPARYCGNCGNELDPEDRFCRTCGRPVHAEARVPTPEADVPVPPPPGQQQAGTGYAPPQQGAVPTQGRSTASKLLIGCLGLVVVAFLFVGSLALLSDGGGGDGQQGQGQDPGQQAGREGATPAQGSPEEEPEPRPEPQPERMVFSGSGPEATRPFELESGLSVIFMQHQGDGNFIVDLLDKNGNSVAPMGVANVIGPFEGSTPVQITRDGQYLLDVQNAGQWQIGILQPRLENAREIRNFSGNSQEATPLFEISGGLHRVEMTHEGGGNFIVDLLDENGAPAVPMGLVNEIGPFDGSRAMQVPDDGIYLFSVQADGPWTITVD